MKKIYLLLIFQLFFFIANNSYANPIISAISTNKINIDTNFNGAEILLFGVKTKRGEIFIVLRGPKKKIMVTKKEKLLGVWHNGKRVIFDDSYSYYSIISASKDPELNADLLSKLELGIDNLKFKVSTEDQKFQEEFKLELIKNLKKGNLYSVDTKNIEFFDDQLFEAVLKFPKNIAYGVYMVEIYLIKDNNLAAFQSIPIFVNQIGNNAKIRNFAYHNSFLYALIAILIAIIAGFIANYIFSRFIHK